MIGVITFEDVAGFVLALIIVTFLHLVIGEMAPKSWAIAHPERSATLLAMPMRGFMWLTRPILIALNGMANWCLRKVNVGALDISYSAQISGARDLQKLVVRDLVMSPGLPVSVASGATIADVRAASIVSGHLRILVRDSEVVSDVTLSEITRPVLTVQVDTPVYVALASMRETNNHLALVVGGGQTLGVVTLSDVLSRLLPITTSPV